MKATISVDHAASEGPGAAQFIRAPRSVPSKSCQNAGVDPKKVFVGIQG
jgi:hypothetical protein